MPGVKVFIVSNVLLYGRDQALHAKAEMSNAWLGRTVADGAACANLQVLNEVTNVMLRKRKDMTAAEVFATVDELSFLGRKGISDLTVTQARELRLATSYSWWDCLLLASALELGCSHFLSEDLQDGQVISGRGGRGLTIVDPFAHSPERILISR